MTSLPINTLSVIIITKNEINNIGPCLESIKFANEIIVLDSGSSDGTVERCLDYTSAVYAVDWPGFGLQKNRALAKCTCEWVLSIDADEIVSDKLAQEIKQVVCAPSCYDAYTLPRQSTYCNRYLTHGDWRNDRCTRLFKRDKASFKPLPIHEELVVAGPIGHLFSPLLHHSFPNLEAVLEKMNRYSTLTANHKVAQGKKGSLAKAILHGLWTFIRGYIFKGGFLDGKRGFMLAISNAEGCYYRYLKMMFYNSS